MVKVGVIGLGSMGYTHLDIYAGRGDCAVVAVSDGNPARLSGKLTPTGNIEGQAKAGFDLDSARKYADAAELIADPEVELVDVCAVTPLHAELGEAALRAGRHVLIEKPVARTAAEAQRLAEAWAATDRVAMVGMCMRFWPGWSWLKEAIDSGRYGKAITASFARIADHPDTRFTRDGDASGGALLDLHLHDADFVRYCFGEPTSVFSRGVSKVTSAIDHVTTQYVYGDGGPAVTAEGGWAMSRGFGFQMRYAVNFEHATAEFDLAADKPLSVVQDGERTAIDLPDGMGYEHEIAHLLECIAAGRRKTLAGLDDQIKTMQLIEAEEASCRTGEVVALSSS